jgi:serine protease
MGEHTHKPRNPVSLSIIHLDDSIFERWVNDGRRYLTIWSFFAIYKEINEYTKESTMRRFMRSLVLVFFMFTLVFALTTPVLSAQGEEARVWVEFAPGQKAPVQGALQGAGAKFHYEFAELDSFVVTLPAAALPGIEKNPNVVSIEEDVPRYLIGSGDALANWHQMAGVFFSTMNNAGQTVPYGINMVQAPQVWTKGVDGTGRRVCVIDTGLYTDHEDIDVGKFADGYSQVGSPWNTDGHGHGTHVAGTIAAADNALGVVGVAPGVSLFIIKIFNDNGQWTLSSDLVDAIYRCRDNGANVTSMSLGGSQSNGREMRAFNTLYNQGILHVAAAGNAGNTAYSYPASYDSVISVAAIDENKVVASFSQQNNQVELAAPGVGVLSTVPFIETNNLVVDGVTYQANHIEFAARGTVNGNLANGGRCNSTGAWSGQVVLCERGDISFFDKVKNVQNSGGVAAVIYNNEPGNFFGTLGDGNSSTIPAISLSQEDGQFLVANKIGQNGDVTSQVQKPASGYEAWNGTSMATPHVSAVAALVWSSNTSLTNVQIRETLQQTAKDLGPAGKDNAYGYGLVQAHNAFVALGGGSEEPPPPPPPTGALSVTVATDKTSYSNRETVTITVTVMGGNEPVSGAAVSVEVRTPNGRVFSGNGTSNSSGVATFTHKININRDGSGTYTVNANASKEGYDSGSGSTTFVAGN